MQYKKLEVCPCGQHRDCAVDYGDHTFCFSCNKYISGGERPITHELTKQVVPYRGHNVGALHKYGVYQLVDDKGEIVQVAYPYKSFTKYRKWPKAGFTCDGENTKAEELFGMDKFNAGSAMAITITEGEEDALSVYEMFDCKYPVVSVRGASSALKDCAANREYLDSFERIYLCFDSDGPGQEAAKRVASLFNFNKVHLVKLTKYKDANEMHQAGAVKEFQAAWYNAKRYVPENIISSYSDFAKVLEAKSKPMLATFPFKQLQEMTRGLRPGETTLFKALEGIGKTELMGAIEYHVLKTTEHNIGVIHLEEDVKRTLQRVATYEMETPVHLQEDTISPPQVLEAVTKATGRENRLHFYEQFGSEDIDSVLNNIRFLASACDCRIIFLDHISRLVSGTAVDDERRALDRISTKLSQLAQELQFHLVMITHVNDDGLTRGSRNISKEAWQVISLSRDIESPDDKVRNTTNLVVQKNRFASVTGPAGSIYFDPLTFKLSDEEPYGPGVEDAKETTRLVA